MSYLIQHGSFVLRQRYYARFQHFFRKLWLGFQGMKVGKGTELPRLHITWPHQVTLGVNCKLEHDIYFKYDGIWQPGSAIKIGDNVFIGSGCEFNISEGITIGNDALIASGCRFIDHNHGTALNELMRTQVGPKEAIIIEPDVWLGVNVVVLKGVTIGQGAIVAAGAIVTKSVGANEIWAGVPAKKIGERK
ncbi:acyltransferase [Hymenobacter volaticus]|uniref:Acyltransferase n=1 Tax=Hymenobacter volaticus TaxID=2932254 RepID=A0ABY4G3X8_9BACT|nr:acyltransferase [Hymenobacter volaticus]UOQ65523.1 hypothetical protein MUN86_18560 [Hymenobacter volaticus]